MMHNTMPFWRQLQDFVSAAPTPASLQDFVRAAVECPDCPFTPVITNNAYPMYKMQYGQLALSLSAAEVKAPAHGNLIRAHAFARYAMENPNLAVTQAHSQTAQRLEL